MPADPLFESTDQASDAAAARQVPAEIQRGKWIEGQAAPDGPFGPTVSISPPEILPPKVYEFVRPAEQSILAASACPHCGHPITVRVTVS